MAYRIYRRNTIKRGNWYYAVSCKGCGRFIYLIDDESGGKTPLAMQGDGQVSTSCIRCNHDDLYLPKEIVLIESQEDIDGTRPERLLIDKSSRKPLMRSYSNASVTFGVGYVEDRPIAAAIIGRIITAWADIERQCAGLLSELMGTDLPSAAAVFSSMRSSRTQHDALEAAAKVTLSENDFELFLAYMSRRLALEKERNDLTHGCYGVSFSIPNGIVWVSQTDYIIFQATINHDPEAFNKFRATQAVYENGTLERISQEIEEYYDQVGFFTGYLSARRQGPQGEAFRVQRYPQLCSQSHIRQALDRIRTAKKAAKSQPKSTREGAKLRS